MITPVQRKSFKKIIGIKHVQKISEHLMSRGVFNTKGAEHSDTYISAVFNGRIANEELEREIWRLVENLLKQHQEETEKREAIMNALDAIEG